MSQLRSFCTSLKSGGVAGYAAINSFQAAPANNVIESVAHQEYAPAVQQEEAAGYSPSVALDEGNGSNYERFNDEPEYDSEEDDAVQPSQEFATDAPALQGGEFAGYAPSVAFDERSGENDEPLNDEPEYDSDEDEAVQPSSEAGGYAPSVAFDERPGENDEPFNDEPEYDSEAEEAEQQSLEFASDTQASPLLQGGDSAALRGDAAGYEPNAALAQGYGDAYGRSNDEPEYHSEGEESESSEPIQEFAAGAQGVALTEEEIKALKEQMAPRDLQFPDPLLSDPQMKALVGQKNAVKAYLLATLDKPGVTHQEIVPLLTQVESVDGEIEKAQRVMNDRGGKVKPLGREYKDEDKKTGAWRSIASRRPDESPEQYEARVKQERRDPLTRALINSEFTVTRRLDDDQYQDARLDVGPDGSVVGKPIGVTGVASGTEELKTGKAEYVLDQDGQFSQFLQKGVQGKEVSVTGMRVNQTVNTHHSSITGEAVMGAGGVEFDKGKITELSNASGHYKPGVAEMIQTVETLLKQGFLLDKELVDAQGNAPTGPAAELAAKAAQQENRLFTSSMKIRAMVRDLDKTADQEERETKEDEIEKLGDWLDGQIDELDKAKQALAKLGIAPSNRISTAKVAFIDGAADKTGLEVRNAVAEARDTAVDVDTFLRSGAGNEDTAAAKLDAKDAVLDSVERKTAQTREVLDNDAENRAIRVEREVAKINERLNEPLPEGLTEEQRNAAERVRAIQRQFFAKGKVPTDKELRVMTESLDKVMNTAPQPAPDASAAPPAPPLPQAHPTTTAGYTSAVSTSAAPTAPPQPQVRSTAAAGYTTVAPAPTSPPQPAPQQATASSTSSLRTGAESTGYDPVSAPANELPKDDLENDPADQES